MNVDTQNHLTALRDLLEFQLNQARTELRALPVTGASVVPESGLRDVLDLKDEAEAARAFEAADATVERLMREVTQCERALDRLTQRSYGDCTDCGEPIPWPRLLAQPAAERCADCQRLLEGRSQRLAQA